MLVERVLIYGNIVSACTGILWWIYVVIISCKNGNNNSNIKREIMYSEFMCKISYIICLIMFVIQNLFDLIDVNINGYNIINSIFEVIILIGFVGVLIGILFTLYWKLFYTFKKTVYYVKRPIILKVTVYCLSIIIWGFCIIVVAFQSSNALVSGSIYAGLLIYIIMSAWLVGAFQIKLGLVINANIFNRTDMNKNSDKINNTGEQETPATATELTALPSKSPEPEPIISSPKSTTATSIDLPKLNQQRYSAGNYGMISSLSAKVPQLRSQQTINSIKIDDKSAQFIRLNARITTSYIIIVISAIVSIIVKIIFDIVIGYTPIMLFVMFININMVCLFLQTNQGNGCFNSKENNPNCCCCIYKIVKNDMEYQLRKSVASKKMDNVDTYQISCVYCLFSCV